MPGPKKPCTVLGGGETLPPGLVPTTPAVATEPAPPEPTSSVDAMTSKDYYFDSYSHFGEMG